MLEVKKVWDVVNGSWINLIIAAQTQKKEENIIVTLKIIK